MDNLFMFSKRRSSASCRVISASCAESPCKELENPIFIVGPDSWNYIVSKVTQIHLLPFMFYQLWTQMCHLCVSLPTTRNYITRRWINYTTTDAPKIVLKVEASEKMNGWWCAAETLGTKSDSAPVWTQPIWAWSVNIHSWVGEHKLVVNETRVSTFMRWKVGK